MVRGKRFTINSYQINYYNAAQASLLREFETRHSFPKAPLHSYYNLDGASSVCTIPPIRPKPTSHHPAIPRYGIPRQLTVEHSPSDSYRGFPEGLFITHASSGFRRMVQWKVHVHVPYSFLLTTSIPLRTPFLHGVPAVHL